MEAENKPNFYNIDENGKQLLQSKEYKFQINTDKYTLKINAYSNQSIQFYIKQTNSITIYYYERNYAYDDIIKALILAKDYYKDIAKIFEFYDTAITKKKVTLKEDKENKQMILQLEKQFDFVIMQCNIELIQRQINNEEIFRIITQQINELKNNEIINQNNQQIKDQNNEKRFKQMENKIKQIEKEKNNEKLEYKQMKEQYQNEISQLKKELKELKEEIRKIQMLIEANKIIIKKEIDKTKIKKNVDDNLNKIGNFKIIKAGPNYYQRKEPVHCLGLENIGATPNMNATIQCLCHVLNVKNYFQNEKLVYIDTLNKKCQLTLEFHKVVNNLWKESNINKEYYTPIDFKKCISEMNPLFNGNIENDSKDLIIFIYETIHNEICKKIKYNNKTNKPDLDLFRDNYYSENCSFIVDTFFFEQQNELVCFNCNFTKISYNIEEILIFPLEKVREYMEDKNPNGFFSITLDNCFENYQNCEILNGPNQIYCNNCKQMANASTRNKIFTCPQVITIILNRGKGLEFDVNFEYPLILNIEKYVTDKKNGENYNYELIGVLAYLAHCRMAGYFIAFCKSPVDNNWYCYNDVQVSKCKDPRFQNNNEIESIPYVLFYQKTKTKNENNKIILFFKYKTKELYLYTEKNSKIKDLVNILHNKFLLSKNIILVIETKKENNCITLDNNKTINDYNLENESYITIIDE